MGKINLGQWIKVPEPYPLTNGGQNIRRTRGPALRRLLNVWLSIRLNNLIAGHPIIQDKLA